MVANIETVKSTRLTHMRSNILHILDADCGLYSSSDNFPASRNIIASICNHLMRLREKFVPRATLVDPVIKPIAMIKKEMLWVPSVCHLNGLQL